MATTNGEAAWAEAAPPSLLRRGNFCAGNPADFMVPGFFRDFLVESTPDPPGFLHESR
jgi:hypothetical protein